MATIYQCLSSRYGRLRKESQVWCPSLKSCCQRRGRIIKIMIKTPRKPNSAIRKVARVHLTTRKNVFAKIPGSGNLPLKYNVVLVKGGGYRDTPCVNYSLVRGNLECLPLFKKNKRRSIYGVPHNDRIRLRRCLRSK